MKLTHLISRKFVACMSMLSIVQLLAPFGAMAETPVPGGAPVTAGGALGNLDLSSSQTSVAAGAVTGGQTVTILVNGRPTQVGDGMQVTPAAALAAAQVLTGGRQTLDLSALQTAVGGSAVLTQGMGAISNMTIPSGVSVLQSMGATNVLNLSGNLTNSGTLFVGGRPGATDLGINAANIFNLAGALITTLPGANINLTLNALENVINSGRITSGGNLTVTAGGAVTNNAGAVMQALNNLNVGSNAGSITNTGSMISDQGNVNFISNELATNFAFNGAGGTVQALNGVINFRDRSFTGTGALDVMGGDFLSNALNLNSGCGFATSDVGLVTGVVNIYSGDAHFSAATPELKMGDWEISHDPFLSNTGNIDIVSVQPKTGSDYVIWAGGNITSSSNSFVINTSSTTINGGHVILAAGVAFNNATITGASPSGGSILLTNLTSSTIIDTSATLAGKSGGDVTLIAYTNPTGTAGGRILLPTGSNIVTSGAGTGNSGNVTIIANKATTATTPITIQIGQLTTTGGAVGSGDINISTSSFNNAVTINKTTGVVLSGSFLGGVQNQLSAITTDNLTTNGGDINITAGRNSVGTNAIVAGELVTTATSGNSGSINLLSGAGGGAGNANILVEAITASGIGNGGNVTVVSAGALTASAVNTFSSGGNAGNVLLAANGGTLIFDTITAQSTGGKGGNVQLTTSASTAPVAGSSISTIGSTLGAGGNVLIAAGAIATVDSTSLTISASSTGGNVNLTGMAAGNTIASSGTVGGGDVNLVAYKVGATTGLVTMPAGGNITSSSGTGAGGDVTVVAGATSQVATPTTVTMNNITTSGANASGGDVTISSSTPLSASVSRTTGALTGSFLGGANQQGVVSIGNVTTSGGDVRITADKNASATTTAITTGAINTSTTGGDGGDVTLLSAQLGAGIKGNITTGAITTFGGLAGSTGGAVTVIAPTNVQIGGAINTGDSTSGGTGAAGNANGGDVLLHASSGSTSGNVSFTSISTRGVSGGNVQIVAGGNISSSTANPIQANAVNTNADVGNGGTVSLIAGAAATIFEEETTITGVSTAGGGSIALTGVGAGNAIDTSTIAQHGSGGTVRMVAYGSGLGTVSVTDDIVTSGSHRQIDTTGTIPPLTLANTWTGVSGDVFAVAAATSVSGSTITLATINTRGVIGVAGTTTLIGTAPGTGFVELVTALPNTSEPVVINTPLGSVAAGSFLGGAYAGGAVSTGAISTSGGNVRIAAGRNAGGGNAINVTSIDTSIDAPTGTTPATSGSGGIVTLMAGLTGGTNTNINVGAISTEGFTANTYPITINGQTVNVPAAIYSSVGGAVNIVTSGNVTTGDITTGTSASANPGVINGITHFGTVGGPVTVMSGSSSTTGNISVGAVSTIGFGGGTVQLYAIGPTSNVAATSISTDTITSISGRNAGPVSLSATGTIAVSGTISTKAVGNSGNSADVLLSSGSASAGTTISTGGITTGTTYNGGTVGEIYVFTVTGSGGSSLGTLEQRRNYLSAPSVQTLGPALVAGAVQALPSGGTAAIPYTLTFNAGSAVANATVLQTLNSVNTQIFSPGGFLNITGSNLRVQGRVGSLVVPMISVDAGGVDYSTGSLQQGPQLTFAGESVTVDTSSTTSAQSGIGAVSRGDVLIDTTNGTGVTTITEVITPTSASFIVANDLDVTGNLIAPTVGFNLNSTAAGHNITTYGVMVGQVLDLNITIPDPSLSTSQGVVSGERLLANSATRRTGVPFRTMSGVAPLVIANATVGSLSLSNVGSVYLQGVQTLATNNANIQIQAIAPAPESGSIAVQGQIEANRGFISLIAESSIFTSGATEIFAVGKTGVPAGTVPTGGNFIYLFAGTHALNDNGILSITGRSGFGGDILLPDLVSNTISQDGLRVSTDINGNGGGMTLAAYSNIAPDSSAASATLKGGRVLLPTDVVLIVDSPNGVAPNVNGSTGITIVGEARGGENRDVTIQVGDLHAGIGSLQIGTMTPNINLSSSVSPKPVNINTTTGAITNTGLVFGGNVQSNASILAGEVSILGTNTGPQQISIRAGGNVTTESLITIGAVGWGPRPSGGTLDAFDGGSGGSVSISADFDVVINGDILTFGGGGGGGLGYLGISPAVNGGKGGNGGNGGTIDVRSIQGSIEINGDINSSGGGGGGGGGGFGGVGGGSNGGAGGTGGRAGNVSIVAQTPLTPGTVAINGTILAAGGGAGGLGGDGDPTTGFAGSGGGGGASFGGGGGGGGAGASQPEGASGFGGAGGGGYFGGGGGDIFNQTVSTGYGGFGGGGFLPSFGPVYQAGPAGGTPVGQYNNSSAGTDGSGSVGGNGGVYSPLPINATVSAIPAQGGVYGKPGAAGLALNSNVAAALLPGNGGEVSTGGADGHVTIGGASFTTPSEIYGGTLYLFTQTGSTGNITVTGKSTITGDASGANPNLPVAPGQIYVTATNGNIIVAPNTTMQLYTGQKGITFYAANPAATITFGTNSSFLASGSISRFSAFVGPTSFNASGDPVVTPVPGTKPANTNVINQNPAGVNTIFFGTAGITGNAPTNTILSLGTNARILFQGTNKNSIVLNGGVTLGASAGTVLRSLDLTNSANAAAVISLQNSGILGGKLTFTTVAGVTTLTGGNVIFYPMSFESTVNALAVPAKVTATFQGFTTNTPVNVETNAQSTSSNVLISGLLNFTGKNVNQALNISGGNIPSFTVASTGKLSTSASLTLTNNGAITLNGPVSAVGSLAIIAGGNFGANTTVSAKGLSIITNGQLDVFGGSLVSTSNMLLSSNFAPMIAPTAKVTASAGTVTIANNNILFPAISINGVESFNISSADLIRITAKAVQIGDSSNPFGSITIGSSLNTVSATTPGSFVGAKDLLFVSAGDIDAGGQTLTLGAKKLTMTSTDGTITTGTISGGSNVSITSGDGGIIVDGNITSTGTAIISLVTTGTGNIDLGNNRTIGGGATTSVISADQFTHTGATNINGSTVNLGSGASGIAALTTNAKSFAVNSTGLVNVTLATKGTLVLRQSSVGDMNLTASAAATTLNITGPVTAVGSMNITMTGLDSKISVQNNMSAGLILALTASGKGTISQTKPTFTLTAGGLLVLSSTSGSFGTASLPIVFAAPSLTATTGTTASAFLSSKVPVQVTSATAGKEFSLISSGEDTSSSAIRMLAPLNSGKVTLKATNVTSGTVSLGGNITTTGTSAAVILQASGAGQILQQGPASVITTKTLTLTSGTGGISLNSANASTNASVLVINSPGAVSISDTFAGAVKVTAGKTTSSLTLNAPSAVASISGNLSTFGGSYGSVILKNTNPGQLGLNAVTATTSANILNPGSLMQLTGTLTAPTLILTSTNGSITATTAANTLTAANTAGTTGVVNITNTGNLVLNASSAGLKFTLTNTGTLTTNAVTTRAPKTTAAGVGGISIITSTGPMLINGNVKASGGGILIRNSDSASSIQFKQGVQVTTLATDKAAAVLNVVLGNGAPNAANAGGFGPGITVLQTAPGVAYAGTNPGNVQAGALGGGTVNALRADVVVDAQGGGIITINKGVLLKADPPGPAPAVAARAVVTTMSAKPSSTPAALTVVSNGGSLSAAVSGTVPSTTVPFTTAVPSNAWMPVPTSTMSMPAAPAASNQESSFDTTNDVDNVVLYDGNAVRSTGTQQAISSGLKPVAFGGRAVPTTRAQKQLVGGVQTVAQGAEGTLELSRGSVLATPERDAQVATPFGTVKLGAKSVALVVVTGSSVAVYNFHDEHVGDVALMVDGKPMPLSPGRHVLLSKGHASYTELNPLPSISHRALKTSNAGKLQAHVSEFSIISALQGLRVWSDLRGSSNANENHIVDTVLKNAAIIMQTQKATGSYRQYKRDDKLAQL